MAPSILPVDSCWDSFHHLRIAVLCVCPHLISWLTRAKCRSVSCLRFLCLAKRSAATKLIRMHVLLKLQLSSLPKNKKKETVFPMSCSGTYALLYSFSSDGICFSLVYCKPESRLLLLSLLACLLTSPLILLVRSRNVIMGHYGSPSVWMSLASESNGAQFALATFNRVVRRWPVVGLRCRHK